MELEHAKINTEANIYSILKKYWNYEEFRPLQKEIILSVLEGNDTLAMLPTGGGKSICFQIPGIEVGGTCLVISPLIALMSDQVRNLKRRGVSAVAISSAMNGKEIEIALNNAALGHVQFLYVSPERLESENFRKQLAYLPISLIAVDEAHCISQWGYDFRPSYLRIAEMREYFPDVKIIAVTASATKEVVKDIQEKLLFKKGNVFRQSFERDNLRYVVQQEDDKFSRLLKIVRNVGGSGVVYVRNRRRTEEIARQLQSEKITADFYHAGLENTLRDQKQQRWINNHTQVIVATNAFGMGIDKPDVRFVVHLDLPDNLEAYFQEAGRAGRDGKPSYAVLLYQQMDIDQLRQQFEENYPSLDDIKQVYNAVCNFYQVAVGSGQGLSLEFDINELCRNYNLKHILVFNAIKFLEREDYLSLLDTGYVPSRIIMTMGKDDLYNFQVKFPKHELLIKTLLRSYGGLFEQYTPIHEKEIGYRIKSSIEQVREQLDLLHEHGVLIYVKSSQLPKIIFLQDRVNTKTVEFDSKSYKALKKRSLERLDTVVHYATQTEMCRSRALLTYFDEQDVQDCGQCDWCLANKPKSEEATPSTNEISMAILKLLQQQAMPVDLLTQELSRYNSARLVETINMLIDNGVVSLDKSRNLRLK